MVDTSARLLRLLSLLQTRRDWSGRDLADRLEVTTRTVRKDMERLRGLGYPIHATPGVAGGYRLGAGAAMPPLLLDDEDAVAVAVGLRTAAGGTVTGIEESSLRALAKLEQVLPSRLRHRVHALQAATVPIPGGAAPVDPDVLIALADACQDHQRLRFDYTDHGGAATLRTVEPHRLAHTGRRWYLVAWDPDRADWRTFRVDRIQPKLPAGPRFRPRDLPDVDVADHVSRGLAAATWRFRARVVVHAPAAVIARRIPPAIGPPAVVDEHTCALTVGSDTPGMLVLYLGLLDADFEVPAAPPELVDELRRLSGRYRRAAGDPT
jgi:predicted DNA-binding transcriptional regulator YafY